MNRNGCMMITGIAGGCARAINDKEAATPISVMNSRRFIQSPRRLGLRQILPDLRY
jgi:hypothetical protein